MSRCRPARPARASANQEWSCACLPFCLAAGRQLRAEPVPRVAAFLAAHVHPVFGMPAPLSQERVRMRLAIGPADRRAEIPVQLALRLEDILGDIDEDGAGASGGGD